MKTRAPRSLILFSLINSAAKDIKDREERSIGTMVDPAAHFVGLSGRFLLLRQPFGDEAAAEQSLQRHDGQG